MLFYIACFEVGLAPVFWVMIAEIFPLRPGTFWIYAGFGLLGTAFFSWRVPESGPTAVHHRRRTAA